MSSIGYGGEEFRCFEAGVSSADLRRTMGMVRRTTLMVDADCCGYYLGPVPHTQMDRATAF